MEQFINDAVEFLTGILASFGIISGIFIVFLESIFPILPLGVFVSLNVITFGSVVGILISWLGTVLGSFFSYWLCTKLGKKFEKKYEKHPKVNEYRKKVDKLSIPSLAILIAIPFTTQFAINIAAGLSKMKKKKLLIDIIIWKLPMVYFWGFIGKSLLESITDISVLAQIAFMLLLAFLVSKLANRFIKEE